MKQFFTRLIKLLVFIFFPCLSFAQEIKDYSLLLNSGKFIPEENINNITSSADLFQKSLYSDRYYVTLQFKTLPDQAVRNQLIALGIELIDYIPNYTYTASLPANFDFASFKSLSLRSVINFTAEQKMVSYLLKGEIPPHAVKQAGYIDLTVITYEKINAAKITVSLNTLGATILEDNQLFRSFVIRVPQSNIKKLAGLPFVQWIEAIAPPNETDNLPGRTLHRVNVLNEGARNLKGDGINVGIWDGGEVSPHLDFLPAGRLTLVETSSPLDHSTHCAGTIGGKGLINPVARGMAPNATIFSYDFNGTVQSEMTTAIAANNLLISSHSYGFAWSAPCDISNSLLAYDAISRSTDIVLNTFPTHLQVHSAGNAGQSCAGGFYTLTGSGKPAKNNIVVGAMTTADAITSFSSSGPVQDGRIKPEITSFGNSVFSTSTPLNNYATMSGTSMATPGVAGASALLYQRYKQLNGNAVPSSALIKNIICNAATDLGNPAPDYRYGFGRIDALTAVRILENNRYVLNTVATGGSNDVTVTVSAGAVRLRAMLTWNDPAAAANANPSLVNNLDLSVINGAATTLPWVLDKDNPFNNATRAIDNISNIEQVTIDNPAAGSYTLRVNGTAVPTGPNQPYSLTWIIEQTNIEVLYPVGGETLSPGAVETITWNNAGVTTNQTVEYSLNNGGNWTTISSSVAATATRLSWTVPSVNTATALIRITSGAITDVSDATFTIFGMPTGFGLGAAGCNAGEVPFIWMAVTNATEYDIYRLNTTTAQFEIFAPNLTGTSYTATGLTPGASMWFALVAKNSGTGAISPRSNAFNAIVSAGSSLSPIGTITGQTIICGNLQNVQYSVPVVTGATTYTWTSPPNTTIASGQGTNTILVNYFAGSTNGNVTVFASAGSCQTSTATLAITVSSGSVAPPTAGSNQTFTVCPPNPIPTLTATATVPAGHTVIWYDAATNGNVVGSPALSSAGTVTYYAASINTTTGCQSSIRSAVTLTINAALPATITTSSSVTFCQGDNVVLTASAGSSYLWSNGATSQTIAVTTTGSYSVVVTTGGCSLTSAATNITVNPIPATTITAGGPTTFCEGSNVVLTASAGSSWLWSNGATSQTITVTNTGAYTVRVTNASSCSATSTATSVTVITRPAVTLLAVPYTKLLPGLNTTLTATVNPADIYTYTWLKNGTAVTGATTLSLPVSLDKLGSYSVTATNNSIPPCSTTSAIVAIEDSVSAKLFIYPNPNSGQFQVNYYTTTVSSYTLSVYDSKGSRIFSRAYSLSIPYQRMDVDIMKHGRGVYQVVLHDKNGKKLASRQVVLQ